MATTSGLMPKGFKSVLKRVKQILRTWRSSKSHGSFTTAATAPPPTSTFSGLSAEINQTIFSMLPDMTSLRALILTCSSLYHCFLDAESLILGKVLQNEIPRSLLSDAFATLKSSKMTPWNQQTADNFRNLFTTFENPPLPPKWSLRTATALSDMHGHVEFFANRFVSTTFSQNPVTGHPQPEYIKASPKELVRIKRAFYRFEFYCNLLAFQRKCDGGCSNVFATNFSKYAPWENEQLACIREHLVEAVSDALKNLPDTSARRITHRSPPDWNVNLPWYYLPLGLKFLHQFVAADSYKERFRGSHSRSLSSESFFIFPSSTTDRLPLSDLDDEDQRNYIPPSFANDGDSGPEEAWRWAHADYRPSDWFNVIKFKGLRDLGYVMWDSSRLAESGILDRAVDEVARPKGLLGNYGSAYWGVGT